MEEKGLKPSPEADRRTLARRAQPRPHRPAARPRQRRGVRQRPAARRLREYVDRLLESPAYGEHRARYWLDAARYADTHGIHIDNYREIWAYRDWVIKAFNANMPFDQFTIEQLAGDLLPNRTLEQQVASGFNRCNITTNEGGAINEEYLVLYARDRTETVSQVFMGLTTGWRSATTTSSTRSARRSSTSWPPSSTTRPRPRWTATSRTPRPPSSSPTWPTAAAGMPSSPSWPGRSSSSRTARRPPGPSSTSGSPRPKPETFTSLIPVEAQKLRARLADRDSAAKKTTAGEIELADVGDFEKDQAFSYGTWVKPSRANLGGALLSRMDEGDDYRGWDLWLEGGKVAAHIIHKWPDDALKVVSDGTLKPNDWNHVLVTYDGSGKASGIKIYLDGKLRTNKVDADALKSSIRTKVPFKLGQRSNSSKVEEAIFQDLRVYGRALSAEEVDRLVNATRAGLPRLEAGRQADPARGRRRLRLVSLDPGRPRRRSRRARDPREGARRDQGEGYHRPHHGREARARDGLHPLPGRLRQAKDPVKADTPDALPPMPSDLPKNRLGFAQWLVRPEHPLTARVTVNRFWQEIFGTGLVKTAGDFGLSGELPTHPELLDWLAVDFRDTAGTSRHSSSRSGTSAAYRQSASTTPEAVEKDPQNRYLARGPRYRMDAEMVRDYALAVSGLLVPKIGGPSVRPYQPEGVWEAVAMPGSDTRNYRQDKGEKLYRGASTPSGSGPPRRPRWTSSTPRPARSAPSAGSGPTPRSRPSPPSTTSSSSRPPGTWPRSILKEGGDWTIPDRPRRPRLLARPFRPEELRSSGSRSKGSLPTTRPTPRTPPS